jgi:hypothetical protein
MIFVVVVVDLPSTSKTAVRPLSYCTTAMGRQEIARHGVWDQVTAVLELDDLP